MGTVPGITSGRARPTPGAEPSTWTAVLSCRFVAAAVIAGLVATLPVFRPDGLRLASVILFVEVVANAVAWEAIRRDRLPGLYLPVADLLLALLIVADVPESLGAAAIVVASSTALYVFWYGPVVSAVLAAASVTGLTLIGLATDPPFWFPAVVCLAVCATTSIFVLHAIARGVEAAHIRHESLVNGLDAVVWEMDGQGSRRNVSGNVAEVLGSTREAFMAPGFLPSRVHPDDRAQLDAARRGNFAGEPSEVHVRVLDDRGTYRHLYERTSVALASDGAVESIRALVVDESARWSAQAEIRRHSEFIAGIPVALMVMRAPGAPDPWSVEIVSMNPAAEAMFGSAPPGTRLTALLPLPDSWVRRVASVAAGAEPYEGAFVELPGTEGVFAIRVVPLPENHVGVSIEDVTKRARLAESFRHQARHDALTGLANRAQLYERLDQVFEGSRPAGIGSVALILVDLDDFKEINDALGHEYGDQVLTQFAGRLGRRLRNCDLVARLGGDEFAVIVTDCFGETHAMDVAQRIEQVCESHFEAGGFRLQVGASIGVAISPQHGADGETLLRHADAAMYQAKAQGGGSVLHTTCTDLGNLRRLQLMADIREALEHDQFELHYQPVIDLDDGTPVGAEALIRWRHPDHGLLAPAEFLELAEVAGLIRSLTRWVGERAGSELAAVTAPGGFRFSMNVPSSALHDHSLLDWASSMVLEGRIDPDRLWFEITETQLMDDPDRARSVMVGLREIGIRFSVDDFGTGYSSLAYLRDLPIDEVKIDHSFVADVLHDDTIVRAVIELGHNLGLRVVAEGVEDAVTAQRLRAMGCDGAQGFHLGAPMPAPALAEHLRGAWGGTVTAQ